MDIKEAIYRLNCSKSNIHDILLWTHTLNKVQSVCTHLKVGSKNTTRCLNVILQGAYKNGLSIEDYRLHLCEVLPELHSDDIVRIILEHGSVGASQISNLILNKFGGESIA